MNRVLVTPKFAEQLGEEQGSVDLRKRIHAAVRLLADDPISNSASAPFAQYANIRAASIGDYLLLFTFDPKKAEVYLLSLLRKSEGSPSPTRQGG